MIVTPPPGLRGNTAIAFQVTTFSTLQRADHRDVPEDLIVRSAEEALLSNTKVKLFRLSKLQDNWDGNGAAAPTSSSVSRAHYLLGLLISGVTNGGLAWREPLVTAGVFGEVVLEWWRNDLKLTIYCSDEGDTFLKSYLEDGHLHIQEGELSQYSLMSLWKWLTLT